MRALLRLCIALAGSLALGLVFHAVAQNAARVPLAGPAAHAFSPHSARVYRLTPGGDALRALDPRSLADRAHGILHTNLQPSSAQNTTVIPTADGTRFLVVNRRTGRSSVLAPRDMTLQLFDGRTGRPLTGRRHPAAAVGIGGVSAGGEIAYGFLVPSPTVTCGPTRLDLLNVATGAVIRQVTIDAPPWSPMLVDWPLHYLYAMTSNDGILHCDTRAPWHPIVSTYDLRTGRRVRRIVLQGVLAGRWRTHRVVSGSPVDADWIPGFALSPDGRQIAVLDGRSDSLTLLAAPSLRIEGQERIVRRQSALEGLASALGLAPEIAEAKGQSQGEALQLQYMPSGRALLLSGTRFLPDSRHPYGAARSLGIRLIDVASGQIQAERVTGRRIVGLWPAPDGSAVYVELQGWRKGTGWLTILRRLDPSTLHVLAGRTFAPASWVSLVFLRGR